MRLFQCILMTCVVVAGASFASVYAQDGVTGNDFPEIGGIGLAFNHADSLNNPLMVTHVGVGLPAHVAGVYAGDVLLSADKVPFSGMDQDAILELLRGEAGTTVAIGIERDGGSHEFEIERTVFDPDTVRFLSFGCFSGDCENGSGILIYPSRERYEGESVDGASHGEGTHTWPDGHVLIGEWSNGRAVNGTKTFPSGDSYSGAFGEQSRRHGYGVLTRASGDTIEGQWVEGRLSTGTYVFASGDQFDGDRYEGEMGDAYQRLGTGTYTWTDGRALQGEWSDDRPLTGTWTSPSGHSYTGAFDEQWRRHGRGVLTLPRGDTIEGQWVGGLLSSASIVYVTGDRYEGDINESFERHGRGVYTYQSGRTDTGDWEADTLTYGTVVYAEGGSYSGRMVNGGPPETDPPPTYTPPPPDYTPPPRVYTPPPPVYSPPQGVEFCIDAIVSQLVEGGWTYAQRYEGSANVGRNWNLGVYRTPGLEFLMLVVGSSEAGRISFEIDGWVGDRRMIGAPVQVDPHYDQYGCSVSVTNDAARGAFANGGPDVSVRVPGAFRNITNLTLLIFER